MKIIKTSIPEVLILEPEVFGDERGFFYESFNQQRWQEKTGLSTTFVQDNHSRSTKGVLRGLHYQLLPSAQGKLVRCIVGEVFDVAVDIRRSSKTFGRWVGVHLTAENRKQFWIPEGFAHGFFVLSEVSEFLYKTTGHWCAKDERCITWNDPDLLIDWPLSGLPILSEKDNDAQPFNMAEVFP